MLVTASWGEFAAVEPPLAARVRERFRIRRHTTLATLRRDGSPRISGIEVEFGEEEVELGLMPGSVKGLDLRCDPRLARHSPTDDPPAGDERAWGGEAKLAGRAVEVPWENPPAPGAWRFRIDVTEGGPHPPRPPANSR